MSTLLWEGAIPEAFNTEFYSRSFYSIETPRRMIVQTYAMEELKIRDCILN